MSVDVARHHLDIARALGVQGVCETCWHGGWCQYAMRRQLQVDAASIALDLAVARAHPALNVRQRQECRWEDRLHKTLLASVAY